jgi:hypothetical protein
MDIFLKKIIENFSFLMGWRKVKNYRLLTIWVGKITENFPALSLKFKWDIFQAYFMERFEYQSQLNFLRRLSQCHFTI